VIMPAVIAEEADSPTMTKTHVSYHVAMVRGLQLLSQATR
jgi:hypothetical protein